MIELGVFEQALRKLYEEVENLAIENDVYYDAILESGNINLPQLKLDVEAAKANPEKRAEVRQRYADLWQAISRAGLQAEIDGLLRELPLSEKPN